MVTLKISDGKERKVLMTAQPKHITLIIGDSLVRGYAERLITLDTFNVTVYVKQNADLDIITTTAKSRVEIRIKWCDNILWRYKEYWEKWDLQLGEEKWSLCFACCVVSTILYLVYQQYAFTYIPLIYVSVSIFVSWSVLYVVLFYAVNVFTVVVAVT